MRPRIYVKMAMNNLWNYHRFYVPHVLTGAGLLGCFFIVKTLALDDRIQAIHGGGYIASYMYLGVWVLALLSVILLLYTNSFLMKQRQREFGLYSVLGMEKHHIGRVLFYETVISSSLSLILGILFGSLFYKLCALVICRLLKAEPVLGFYYLSSGPVLSSAAFFAGIYLVTFLLNLIRISRRKPVELMNEARAGEKAPKVQWLFLIVGIVCLGAGYYLSFTAKNPVDAVVWFFAAVFLVVIGTYGLFMAVSVAVLKFMISRPQVYYHKLRMPVIAGLLFRMKQNAAGLASITILVTMVLVMLSTTFSLYSDIESSLEDNYPQHWYLEGVTLDNGKRMTSVALSEQERLVREAAEEVGLAVAACDEQVYLEAAFLYDDGVLLTDRSIDNYDSSQVVSLVFISCEQYLAATGTHLDLGEDGYAVCSYNLHDRTDLRAADALTIGNRVFRKCGELTLFPIGGGSVTQTNISDVFGIVLPDEAAFHDVDDVQKAAYGPDASSVTQRLAVTFESTEAALDKGASAEDTYNRLLSAYLDKEASGKTRKIRSDSVWRERDMLYGMDGSLLFLGLLLGLAFLLTTALIIYYKQTAEGFEDRTRYQIMEKIGMSREEVRRTIGTQILFVFFLPPAAAALHTAAAFPMLSKILTVMLRSDTNGFLICTVVVFAVILLIYAVIYLMTARVYYKIVS